MTTRRKSTFAAWIVVAVGVWLTGHHAVRAGEKCPCSCAACTCACAGCCDAKTGSVTLSTFPYFTRLFGFSFQPAERNPADTNGTGPFERIGIDLDLSFSPFDRIWSVKELSLVGHQVEALPCENGCALNPCLSPVAITAASSTADCPSGHCLLGNLANATACTGSGEFDTHAVCVAASHGVNSTTALCTDASETCNAHAGGHDVATCHSHMERLIAENAGLKVALESRQELMELRAEMAEKLMQVVAEKVHLESRLAMTESIYVEREKLFREMRELAADNARLKAQAEAAVAYHAVEKAGLQAEFEKGILQQRVAELERQVESSAARTAKRPNVGSKAPTLQ